ALNAGGRIMRDGIKAEAPVSPRNGGTLKANIRLKRAKDGVVKIHSGKAYHAHLVEFGRSGGSAKVMMGGKMRTVYWGPTTPNPFMDRGFHANKNTSQDAMADALRRELGL